MKRRGLKIGVFRDDVPQRDQTSGSIASLVRCRRLLTDNPQPPFPRPT
jgi:hypothetical protein